MGREDSPPTRLSRALNRSSMTASMFGGSWSGDSAEPLLASQSPYRWPALSGTEAVLLPVLPRRRLTPRQLANDRVLFRCDARETVQML